jgi:hypothetical protein
MAPTFSARSARPWADSGQPELLDDREAVALAQRAMSRLLLLDQSGIGRRRYPSAGRVLLRGRCGGEAAARRGARDG